MTLIVCIAVAVLAALYASSHPDGLEWVAERLGFASRATEAPALKSPMPDYSFLPIESPFWSNAVAGLVGVVVVFGAAYLIGWIFRDKKSSRI